MGPAADTAGEDDAVAPVACGPPNEKAAVKAAFPSERWLAQVRGGSGTLASVRSLTKVGMPDA